MTIRVEGLKRLERRIDEIPNRTMSGVKKAIELIYKRSQPLVPVDTGQLKRSGRITQIQDGYQLKYQAFNEGYDYAPIVHENLHFRHPIHRHGRAPGHEHGYNCGGQAKYLESAVDVSLDEIKDIIVKEAIR